MSISRANLRTAVRDVARVTTTHLTDSRLDRAINHALRQMSQDKPQTLTVALGSDSDLLYTMTDVIAAWGEGYFVRDIHYMSNDILKPIDPNAWHYYELAGVGKLKITEVLDEQDELWSSSSTAYYVEYGYPYSTSDDPIVIGSLDEDALVALASARAAEQAAAEAADQKNASFSADVMNYQEIIDKWLKIARRQESIYQKHIDSTPEAGSNGGFAEWDLKNSLGSMIFHGSPRH